jgi:hypothetical protein
MLCFPHLRERLSLSTHADQDRGLHLLDALQQALRIALWAVGKTSGGAGHRGGWLVRIGELVVGEFVGALCTYLIPYTGHEQTENKHQKKIKNTRYCVGSIR